jgi:hypothetical protein
VFATCCRESPVVKGYVLGRDEDWRVLTQRGHLVVDWRRGDGRLFFGLIGVLLLLDGRKFCLQSGFLMFENVELVIFDV